MVFSPLRRLRAWWGNYFWHPCPVCGHMFGGFEYDGNLITGPGCGRVTCRRCPFTYVIIDGEIYKADVIMRDDHTYTPMFYKTGHAAAPDLLP